MSKGNFEQDFTYGSLELFLFWFCIDWRENVHMLYVSYECIGKGTVDIGSSLLGGL